MKKYIVFILILAVAGFIFTVKLSEIPNGFYVDEATLAYNAYSIYLTGADEYGEPFPKLIRAFGTYTPPLFSYLSMPVLKIFGLQDITFRLVSAISALISVIFFFLIIRRMRLFSSDLSLYLVTFFYAISPWLVFYARSGYEMMLGYAIFNIGLYFFYRALENSSYLILGLPILSLSLYASFNERYLFPIFVFFYFFIFRASFLKKSAVRNLSLTFILTFLVQIPTLMVFFTPSFWTKNSYLTQQSFTQITTNVASGILHYFSPSSLFYNFLDVNLQHSVPEISVMYNWMVIPYFIGLFALFRQIKKTNLKFIALLFFTSIIPAALAGEFASIQRSLPFLLPLSMVIGLGINFIISKMSRIFAVAIFGLLICYSLLMLYRSYFILFPKERAAIWNYGYDSLAQFITSHPGERFVIDNKRTPAAYIELLYFLRYSPTQFQQEIGPQIKDSYYQNPPVNLNFNFSNIAVRPIDWTSDSYKNQILIGDELTISEDQANEHHLTGIYQLKDPVGQVVFQGYKTDPEGKCREELSSSKIPSPYCTLNKNQLSQP